MIATETLRQGQIINIISFNRRLDKKVRRVKVQSLATIDSRVEIIGVNMKGLNPIPYLLSAYPVDSYEPVAGAIYWRPFEDRGEGEE